MKRNIDEIRKDIVAHLKWDNRLDSSNIQVDIVGNAVKLSGFVKSALEKSAAENDVRSIPGVIKVENSLEIRLEGYELHSDEQIAWNVKSVLVLNSQINHVGIEVSVNKGNVILTGTVDQYWKKLHIEEIVHMVPGVMNVINTLAVVHTAIPFDKTIAQEIIKAFERIGTINPENITIEVEGGRVVLRGKVPDWYSYSSAHNIVKFTRGVTDLVNNLIISE
jgi:osmotically-inducible protein OsmY